MSPTRTGKIFNFQIDWGRKWFFDVKIDWYTDVNCKETDSMRFSLRCNIWPIQSFLDINQAILDNCHGLQTIDFRPGDLKPEGNDRDTKFIWRDYLRELVNKNPRLCEIKLRIYGDNDYMIETLAYFRTKPNIIRVHLTSEIADIENVAEKAELLEPSSNTEFRILPLQWCEERIVRLSRKKMRWFHICYALKEEKVKSRAKFRKEILLELITEFYTYMESR